MTFLQRVLSCVVDVLGKKSEESFRCIYASADWHYYNGHAEVKERNVCLGSQIRTEKSWMLFGKCVHWEVQIKEQKPLVLKDSLSETEVQELVLRFLETVNPEGLPLKYEEDLPELVRETVDFLSRKSHSFVWGGWATFAKP
jgi:hypothetical protein